MLQSLETSRLRKATGPVSLRAVPIVLPAERAHSLSANYFLADLNPEPFLRPTRNIGNGKYWPDFNFVEIVSFLPPKGEHKNKRTLQVAIERPPISPNDRPTLPKLSSYPNSHSRARSQAVYQQVEDELGRLGLAAPLDVQTSSLDLRVKFRPGFVAVWRTAASSIKRKDKELALVCIVRERRAS